MRLRNPAIPAGLGNIGGIFLRQTTRIKGNRARAAAMRPIPHDLKSPYPELSQLAKAVLRQACVDAGHLKLNNYGMRRTRHTRAVLDRYQRNAAWDALIFLTDPNDEWLDYWCGLAGLNARHLRHEFQPYRDKFEREGHFGQPQ